MTIQQINITNLYGNNYKWQLNPDVNILVGANGTYKSTILKLIEYINNGISIDYITSNMFDSPGLEVELVKDSDVKTLYTTHIDKLEEENLDFVKSIIPNYRGYHQSSKGEKSLLKILAIKCDLIFLDNPENNLHIDWQRNLIKWIRELNPSCCSASEPRGDCQIIMTTHSPTIFYSGWIDKVTRIEDIKVN